MINELKYERAPLTLFDDAQRTVFKHMEATFFPRFLKSRLYRKLHQKLKIQQRMYGALKANDIGIGDEVITTPFTWIITSHAIASAGAKPVFVDIDDNFNLAPYNIEKAINKKTKSIVPMHVAG